MKYIIQTKKYKEKEKIELLEKVQYDKKISGDIEIECLLLKNMSAIYESNKNFKKANEYLKEIIKVKENKNA